MNEILNEQILATTLPGFEQQQKLSMIKDLLDALHVEKINYCHWKSNEHLDASMVANTDLDILFDEKQKEKVINLLQELGFKKFASIKQKQYKDIEDYIGLDFKSGKIIHLHTHFRLTMGEAYLKSYQLNLEDKILKSRVFDETFGIYRSHPAFELILLYFRESLKIRNRDIIKVYLKNKIYYTGNIINEYRWLKQRCTENEIENILKTIVIDYQPILRFVTGEFNRKQLLKLSVLVKREFKNFRLFSPFEALVLRWYREHSITVFRKSAKLMDRPVVSQRINPRGGLVIAVLGADGSGKSTVIANLQSTFSKKLDVYKVYLGKGNSGSMSWQRKFLYLLKKNLAAFKGAKNKIVPEEKISARVTEKKTGLKSNLFECINAIIVAGEKRKSLKHINAAKKKGMLVICDRFPQKQVMGYNDGPVLQHLSNSPNPLFHYMSKLEHSAYAYAENNPPDIVFKLIADAKVIEARKPNSTSLEILESKIEGIKKITFAEGCRVITVDASQTLEKVLYTIKKAIWEVYL